MTRRVSYQVFARKYRPQRFGDVVGQGHVVRTLQNAIEQNRLAHAYLFVGPRGVGKTSTARILAKALNCTGGPRVDFDPEEPICQEIAEGRCLDVLEIDGASNNGVEQVRELRENVRFAPTHGAFKIYIIDEVHMLTTAAFNALLKTLEEPPPHVKFIFATTEPHKVLPTILSRCQRFDLSRIKTSEISEHLLHIAKLEKIDLSEKAALAIARAAEGGLRDAESMLDQLVAFCGDTIEEDDVLHIFGLTGTETVSALAGEMIGQATSDALNSLREHAEEGRDLMKLLGDLIGYLRNLLVLKSSPESLEEEHSAELGDVMAQQSEQVETEHLLLLIETLAEAEGRMKWAPNKRLHFEVALIKCIHALSQTSLGEVIAAVSRLAGGDADGQGAGNGRGGGDSGLPSRPAPRVIRPEVKKAAARSSSSSGKNAGNSRAQAQNRAAAPEPAASVKKQPAAAPIAEKPAFGDRDFKSAHEIPADAVEPEGEEDAPFEKRPVIEDDPNQGTLFSFDAEEMPPEERAAPPETERKSAPQAELPTKMSDAQAEAEKEVRCIDEVISKITGESDFDILGDWKEDTAFFDDEVQNTLAELSAGRMAEEKKVELTPATGTVTPVKPGDDQKLDTTVLWQTLRDGEQELGSLMLRRALENAAPLAFDGNHLTVGFHHEDGILMESFKKKRQTLEQILREKFGTEIKLRFQEVGDNELPGRRTEFGPEEEGIPSPDGRPDTFPSTPAIKPDSAIDCGKTEEEILAEFRNDPLIQKALEIFDAEIASVKLPARN